MFEGSGMTACVSKLAHLLGIQSRIRSERGQQQRDFSMREGVSSATGGRFDSLSPATPVDASLATISDEDGGGDELCWHMPLPPRSSDLRDRRPVVLYSILEHHSNCVLSQHSCSPHCVCGCRCLPTLFTIPEKTCDPLLKPGPSSPDTSEEGSLSLIHI